MRNSSSARMAAGRQGADVPDDRPLGIEIGGADHQQAALLVLARDGVEHLLVGVARDHLRERRGVGHGVIEQGRAEATRAVDLLGRHGRVDLAQGGVVIGPEEGEGRDQGAGADAGHHLEFGPRPGFGPAVHQPGAKGAVVAAAGYGEVVHRRQFHAPFPRAGVAGGPKRRLLALEGAHAFPDHRLGVTVGEEARVGDTERQSAGGCQLEVPASRARGTNSRQWRWRQATPRTLPACCVTNPVSCAINGVDEDNIPVTPASSGADRQSLSAYERFGRVEDRCGIRSASGMSGGLRCRACEVGPLEAGVKRAHVRG